MKTAAGLLLAGFAWIVTHRGAIDTTAIEAWVQGLGVWAPIVFVLLYATATALLVPGSVFTLAGGALFGPELGTVVNLTGATLGATAAFFATRLLLADRVRAMAGARVGQMMAGVEAEGWRFVAFTRLVPLIPFNVLNFVLGLTRIPASHYILTSLVCMAPATIGYTWLGWSGRQALAGDASAIRYGLIALAIIAAAAFLPRLLRRLRGGAADMAGWIDVTGLARRLETDRTVALVDVRGPDEFDGPLGHIAGARNLPVGQIASRIGTLEASRTGPVVLICRTHKRSAAAAEILRGAGFADVQVLRDGMEAWNRAGLPVERRQGAVPRQDDAGLTG
jgi:uncharacterized membrane protein YdjX (TVP38/TMEM64 family)/rhodanese-related sulfurtransferase